MATFNTSEILTAAHKSAKYDFRMSRGRNYWNSSFTYRQIFALALKKSWDAAKVAAEPVQKFTISLAYAEHDLRGTVKKLGGKWNADAKTWSVSCKKSQLGGLEKKIVNGGSISGFGFAAENTYTNRMNMMKYGYDAIEM